MFDGDGDRFSARRGRAATRGGGDARGGNNQGPRETDGRARRDVLGVDAVRARAGREGRHTKEDDVESIK